MIESQQDHEHKITILTAYGRVSADEIHTILTAFYAGNPTPKVLCDLTRATVADLATSEIEDIIDMLRGHIQHQLGGRTAIVTIGSADFGLARMFGTFAELAGLPMEVKVFRTMEVARAWLDELDQVTTGF